MATLKEAISIAKTEPNSERSQKLLKDLTSGKLDAIAAAEGIDLTKFKAKNSPMGNTTTNIPSVAEREGWLPKLVQNLPGAMQKFAEQTNLKAGSTPALQHDKSFESLDERADIARKINDMNPASPARLPLNAELQQINNQDKGLSQPKPDVKWYEPPPEEMGLDPVQRLTGAVKGMVGAAKEGAQNFGSSVKEASEGADISFVGKSNLSQSEKFNKTIDDAFAAGKIDQAEYDRLKGVSQKVAQRAEGMKKEGAVLSQQGFTGAMKGLSEVAASPVTGGVTGAFKPEFEALGQRVAGNEQALKAIQLLNEKWDGLDPSLQNSLATVLNLGGLGVGKKVAKEVGEQAVRQGVNVASDVAEFGGKAARQLPIRADEFLTGLKQRAAATKIGVNDFSKGMEARKMLKAKEAPAAKVLDRLAGVNEAEANAIRNYSIANPKKADELIRIAENSLKSNQAINPTQQVADWAKKGIGKLEDIRENIIGKKIGDIKKKMVETNGTISSKPIKSSLIKFFGQDNVGVRFGGGGKDGIDFRGSIFENSPADQKFIRQIYRETAKGSIPIDVALRRITRIANELYSGSSRMEFTNSNLIDKAAEIVRKGYRQSIDDFATKTKNSELLELNKQFSEISSALFEIEKKLGADGVKSAAKIRQAFSNSGQPLKEFFARMNELGKKYDIEELKDIIEAGDFAISVESALGTFAPTGIENVIRKGVGSTVKDTIRDFAVGSKIDAVKRVAARNSKELKQAYRKKTDSIKDIAKLGVAGIAGKEVLLNE